MATNTGNIGQAKRGSIDIISKGSKTKPKKQTDKSKKGSIWKKGK